MAEFSTISTPDSAQPCYNNDKIYKFFRTRLGLRGCGCPSCDPSIYSRVWPRTADASTLTWGGHDPAQLAHKAAASFTGAFFTPTQEHAFDQWNRRLWYQNEKTSERMSDADLEEAVNTLSDIFFLGALSTSEVSVTWGPLASAFGQSTYTATPSGRENIVLNSKNLTLTCSPNQTMRVLLHEMAHCFLTRYSYYPWSTPEDAEEYGPSYLVGLGASGHGRAWHVLVEAIEDKMWELLGLGGDLGRDCGQVSEVAAGGYLPCTKEVEGWEGVYSFQQARQDWEWLRMPRDDDPVMVRAMIRKSTRNARCRRAPGRRHSESIHEMSSRDCRLKEEPLGEMPVMRDADATEVW